MNATPPAYPLDAITGAVLAGGLGRRMGGQDKGLLPWRGRPLAAHMLDILRPQAGRVLLNVNRNLESYEALGCPLVSDSLPGFHGPLAGLAAAMQAARGEYLLAVPCDTPFLPADLGQTLWQALFRRQADISAAHDGERLHPLCVLLRVRLLPDLLAYLDSGERKVVTWYRRHAYVEADFSERRAAFANFNSPADFS